MLLWSSLVRIDLWVFEIILLLLFSVIKREVKRLLRSRAFANLSLYFFRFFIRFLSSSKEELCSSFFVFLLFVGISFFVKPCNFFSNKFIYPIKPAFSLRSSRLILSILLDFSASLLNQLWPSHSIGFDLLITLLMIRLTSSSIFDSFSYLLLLALEELCISIGVSAKRSEIFLCFWCWWVIRGFWVIALRNYWG